MPKYSDFKVGQKWRARNGMTAVVMEIGNESKTWPIQVKYSELIQVNYADWRSIQSVTGYGAYYCLIESPWDLVELLDDEDEEPTEELVAACSSYQDTVHEPVPTTGLYVMTYPSETVFKPFQPEVDQIKLVDIAWATSMNVRFNGHVRQFYSVAQHCVEAAIRAKAEGASVETQLYALLHDASEAYLSDIASPIKRGLEGYRELEDHITEVIVKRFKVNLDNVDTAMIGSIDKRLLLTEARDLISTEWMINVQAATDGLSPYMDTRIQPLDQRQAFASYITMFENLMIERIQ